MATVQTLLEALREARRCVAAPGQTPGPEGPAGLERAAASLEALLAEGLPAMDAAQASAVASEMGELLASNSLNLKWSRLRAELAGMGVPRPAAKVAGPRLDLVS